MALLSVLGTPTRLLLLICVPQVAVNKVLGFGSMGMVYFGVLWDMKVGVVGHKRWLKAAHAAWCTSGSHTLPVPSTALLLLEQLLWSAKLRVLAAWTQVVVKMIEHGAGLLGKEQHRGKLARTEVCEGKGGQKGGEEESATACSTAAGMLIEQCSTIVHANGDNSPRLLPRPRLCCRACCCTPTSSSPTTAARA